MAPIVTPDKQFVQQESIAPSKPVSEYTLFTMGASINYLLSVAFPVGTILPSMLTEAQFQGQLGNPSPVTWILSDGRSIGGSALQKIASLTNAPDLRGRFVRMDSGSSGVNPDGNLPLGAYQADQFASHNHNFSDPGHGHGFNQSIGFLLSLYKNGSDLSAFDQTFDPTSTPLAVNSASTGVTFLSNGGNETRAKNITINWFIRVN